MNVLQKDYLLTVAAAPSSYVSKLANILRIFYTKLYILLSVGGSTNSRNEIIWGWGDYKRQIL